MTTLAGQEANERIAFIGSPPQYTRRHCTCAILSVQEPETSRRVPATLCSACYQFSLSPFGRVAPNQPWCLCQTMTLVAILPVKSRTVATTPGLSRRIPKALKQKRTHPLPKRSPFTLRLSGTRTQPMAAPTTREPEPISPLPWTLMATFSTTTIGKHCPDWNSGPPSITVLSLPNHTTSLPTVNTTLGTGNLFAWVSPVRIMRAI